MNAREEISATEAQSAERRQKGISPFRLNPAVHLRWIKRALTAFVTLLAVILSAPRCGAVTSAEQIFLEQGSREYAEGHFEQAAASFGQAAAISPSPGTLQNLGTAEWQRGDAGAAILAWERSQWLDPLNASTRGNLRFARRARFIDAPELAWYEICSTWLPVNAWPWIASLSFWLAAAMVLLPSIFRWRRASWHQALAASGFAIFLLTLPAMAGVQTRAKMGVVLLRDTPLRLTPTSDAENVARLAAGDVARQERERGNYIFVRTSTEAGWIERSQLGLISRSE